MCRPALNLHDLLAALKYLFSGKNGDEEEPIATDDEDEEEAKEDDPLLEDYLDGGDDEDESLEFGKPFLTSLDDVDGKFLVVPLHVTGGGQGGKQMKGRATAAAAQRRSG